MSVKGKAILKRGVKGGSGSGNYGHSGRPGKLGGSIPKGAGGGAGSEAIQSNEARLQALRAQRDALKTKAGNLESLHKTGLGTNITGEITTSTPPANSNQGSLYNQAQAISGGTLGNIPLGVPTSNASKVSQQLLQQHIERKSGFHIKDDEAIKTSDNQMVRTTIKPYEYNPSKLEVTHEVKQGKEWVPSFTQPYLAKTEYDAFYTGMIDHNRLVRASNKTT